jgi:hypothetical protein
MVKMVSTFVLGDLVKAFPNEEQPSGQQFDFTWET